MVGLGREISLIRDRRRLSTSACLESPQAARYLSLTAGKNKDFRDQPRPPSTFIGRKESANLRLFGRTCAREGLATNSVSD